MSNWDLCGALCGAFNFSVFKALLNALHCGDKFMVKSLLKAPAPPRRLTIMKNNKWPGPFGYTFFPYPMEDPHENWLQLAQWFQRRYLKTHTHTHTQPETFLHTRTQQLRVFPDEKIWGGGGGWGAWRQSTIFLLWGGGEVADHLAFVKILIFCRWWSFSKIQDLLELKEVPIFRRGLSRKKKRIMRVPWWWCWLISWPYRWWFSREVKSRRIHCIISKLTI